jgi:hypothetical protein
MIVSRIVMIEAFSNQADQEVSVDSFVMMKRNKLEIVETKKGGEENDRRAQD